MSILVHNTLKKLKIIALIGFILIFVQYNCLGTFDPGVSKLMVTDTDKIEFQNDLKERTFNYFWEVVDSVSWQTDDRHPTKAFTSIAATGFAFPAYIIGIHNDYISRTEGSERVHKALKWLWNSTQSDHQHETSGYKGFFYHFLEYGSGKRFRNVELSTIDTALLMAGILTVQSFFNGDNLIENEIRWMADSLYLRVDWNWAMNGNTTMSMGWRPESGFIESQWAGYNEAMILLILAKGSPTHSIPDGSWDVWTSTYNWEEFYGYEHVNFGPLFGHQYSHMFVDFRNIYDDYMMQKGIDYFENSRRATLSNRAYCIDNPLGFKSYGENIWGLTASDGPSNLRLTRNGKMVQFRTYHARGAATDYREDDGTIAPAAAGGSIPFAPIETLEALYTMKNQFGEKAYQKYGFIDSFNLTYHDEGWFNPDYIGIDQGAILIQLENHHSGLIWNILKENPYIQSGLKEAGFKGGWLDEL